MIAPPSKSAKEREFKLHFPWDKDETHIKFHNIDVLAAVIAVVVGGAYVATKHWVLSNILGISFSISGITYLSLGSYKVGAILLLGLFVYDIFWVFGTDVMVTVAKSFDAPIKLLFPRDIFAAEFKHSMLGLGDIVIPGIFVALLARFDKSQAIAAAAAKKPGRAEIVCDALLQCNVCRLHHRSRRHDRHHARFQGRAAGTALSRAGVPRLVAAARRGAW
jgi:presenilin-like A22 family membrane protease